MARDKKGKYFEVKASELEAQFSVLVKIYRLPKPAQEFRFDPVRRFRFDFAWETQKLAVEINGGTWSRGRHSRGSGQRNDCIKLNLAIERGWRVLQFTGDMLKDDPHGCLMQVKRCLEEG